MHQNHENFQKVNQFGTEGEYFFIPTAKIQARIQQKKIF
jgi:hypothetical protein